MSHWQNVPLADYEGHMSATGVEQLAPLADRFRHALAQTNPESVAILGIAGGNGLEHVNPAIRTVGIDINAEYLDVVAQRHPSLQALELHHHDLAQEPLRIPPVDLVHAALVFEHAGTGQCLENAINLLNPTAHLSVVLQLPSDAQSAVAPTPYPSIQSLKESFQHIDPAWLVNTLATRGLQLESETRHPLPSGKAFWHGIFKR